MQYANNQHAALTYAEEKGWAVFPVHYPIHKNDLIVCSCGHDDCDKIGKHPMTPNGVKDATKNPRIIRTWWERWPFANVAVATGDPSGIDVLDVDGTTGRQTANEYQKRYGTIRTLVQATGGGGLHAIMKQAGVRLKNAVEFAPGLDIRTTGGYIVVAPSLHFSGQRYTWSNDRPPAPFPQWLIDEIQKADKPTESRGTGQPAQPIEKGRNHALWRYACSMAGHGVPLDQLRRNLHDFNQSRCLPPKDDKHIDDMAERADRYGPNAPRSYENARDGVEMDPGVSEPTDAETDVLERNSEPRPEVETVAQLYRDPPFKLEDFVYPGSWLDTYCDYVQQGTDAPRQFGLLCGLSALSMACSEAWIRYGHQALRPNLWLAVIAPSTLYRKTTSINIARKALGHFQEDLQFPEENSPEAFFRLMKDQPTGYFMWSEMQNQLSAFERSYMRGYRSMLTDLYDCPSRISRRTNSDGLIVVERPYVNIMAASTQEWLSECLNDGDLKGGFLPRFLWVMASDKPTVQAWPGEPSHRDAEVLGMGLTEISGNSYVEMGIDDEAKSTYVDYYHQMEAEANSSEIHSGTLGAFYGRLAATIVKLSMLYQLDLHTTKSSNFSGNTIEPHAMGYALKLASYLRTSIRYLLDEIATDPEMKLRIAIIKALREAPGLRRSELLRKVRCDKEAFDKAMATLLTAEQVVEEAVRRAERGPATLTYYLTKDKEGQS